jgi:phosphatidylglycerol:prolipoprotein diacylglycerol transferase
LTGSLLFWCRHPFPFWPMADAAAPAVAIGAAVGRLGCFLNGCCDGVACSLPWGVRFPAGSHAWTRQANAGLIAPDAPFSLPVHPTQLYAALAGLFVLCALMAYFPRRRRPGQVIALLMILYSLTRWPIESLRGDEPALILGMTSAQLISLALLAGGLVMWLRLQRPIGPKVVAQDMRAHHRELFPPVATGAFGAVVPALPISNTSKGTGGGFGATN